MNNQKGEIIMLVLVVAVVVLVSTLIIIGGAQLYYQNSTYSVEASKALNLAEAGLDKAVATFNKVGSSYGGESETFLGNGSFSVKITTKDVATKIIESTGYIPNKTSPRVRRTTSVEVSQGVGISFVYGIQVGEGGLQLGNSNIVTGSIYSNGNITAGQGNRITGDAWVAGGPQSTPDQQTDCQDSNCIDYFFGKTVGADERLDVTQAFKPQTSGPLNKISVKIRKIQNPPDVTVRIVSDYNGTPDKRPGGVLATGILYASLVSNVYGWIDVTFDSSPNLVQNSQYWILLDTSSDSINYWSWQNDLVGSYIRGVVLWSPNWTAGNPQWNSITGSLSFKSYMGGIPTALKGGGNFNVDGDAHAHTIDTVSVGKDAYFQTLVSSSVSGKSYPNSVDPPPKVFPLSEANVTDWKNQAVAADIRSGNINNCVTTLNAGKIIGNVDLGSNCTVTVKSPVWITGNLTFDSNVTLKLSSEYGNSSGVIVVDGQVTMNSNNHLQGTGTGSSLLMVLSTYDSRSNGQSAVSVNSQGNSGVYYASMGIIQPGTNNSFKELTAWGIKLINNSLINYETGLSSTLFTSGPSGSYTLVPGTYQVR